MRIDPCGTIMDFIRSPYRTRIRPFKNDDTEVTIRWFFADPDAKVFPAYHRFASGNNSSPAVGDERFQPSAWQGIGEVAGAPREWCANETPEWAIGQNFCGTLDEYRNGCLYDPDWYRPTDDDGRPLCCQKPEVGGGPPEPPPTITTCQYLNPVCEFWEVSAPGVGIPAGACPDCHILADPCIMAPWATPCEWRDVARAFCGYPAAQGLQWRLFLSPPSGPFAVVYLTCTWFATGQVQAQYAIAKSAFNPIDVNVLNLTNAAPVCNGWPATITIKPSRGPTTRRVALPVLPTDMSDSRHAGNH